MQEQQRQAARTPGGAVASHDTPNSAGNYGYSSNSADEEHKQIIKFDDYCIIVVKDCKNLLIKSKILMLVFKRDQNRGFSGQKSQQKVISQPPWMQAEQISTWEKLEICLYKFVSIFPVFVTFGLYSFLATFYCQQKHYFLHIKFQESFFLCEQFEQYIGFYIYPMMAGNFDTLLGIPNLWKDSIEREAAYTKASILLGVFSFLTNLKKLFPYQSVNLKKYKLVIKGQGKQINFTCFLALMLGTSIIQTIRTSPGSIPEDKEWDMQSDSVLESSSDDDSNSIVSESKIDKQNDPLTNFGIEEDQEEPKEAAHLDYKYLKSYEGPLAKPITQSNKAESDVEKEKLIKAKKNPPRPIFSVERKKFGGIRMCQRCLRTKPDRCHHCSQCNKCVLKMDHHCPWVANCIGFYNYKYFINMLFYCTVTVWLLIWTSYPVVQEVMSSETIDYKLAYYIITAYILGTSLAVVISAFFAFHIYLILNQYTTIEFCEKKREDDTTFKVSPYNRGRFNNLKYVLGGNVLLWFVPFFPNLQGEGLMFEVRDDLKQQLKLF